MTLEDRLDRDGTIQFKLKGSGATIGPVAAAPLTATLVLGQRPAAGLAGRCGKRTFGQWLVRDAAARFFL